jgi:type IV pilus assembly protein PilO
MAKLNITLSKQQQQALIVAVLFLGGGGYAYFRYFWNPISKRILENREKTKQVETQILKAKGQAARLPKIKEEVQVLNQQAAEAEKQLPKKKDIPAVIDTVSALSAKYNVRIQSFAPGGSSTSQYFIELPYTISLKGAYHDVARFFAAVALEQRIFNIRNVTYSEPDAESRLSVNFTLISYQYKG